MGNIGGWTWHWRDFPFGNKQYNRQILSASEKRRVKESSIFTTLAAAYDAMSDNQNDTLYVYPGRSSRNCNFGMGERFHEHCWGWKSEHSSLSYYPGDRWICANQKPHRCGRQHLQHHSGYVSMFGISTYNNVASTSARCDIHVSGPNFDAKKCFFRGGNNTTQMQHAMLVFRSLLHLQPPLREQQCSSKSVLLVVQGILPEQRPGINPV